MLQESNECIKNEMADKKLWLFNSTLIELTIAGKFLKEEFLVETVQEIGKITLL